ncbi:glycosyltransferase [uncultured Reyranella sp.]|uniref:glycosyltransferase n=1 Tax=uncultured Reyranella sp. TaxID=735512 RepID=UPI0025EC909D|nr:glycosyltransferase [uncultured Reyranella sp.]
MKLVFPLSSLLASRHWCRLDFLTSVGLNPAHDPLHEVLALAPVGRVYRRHPSREVRAKAHAIRDAARAANRRDCGVAQLLPLIREYPRSEELQKIVARLLTESEDERAPEAWLGISMRFPDSMDAFRNAVNLVLERNGEAVVRTIVRARFPRMPARLEQLLAYAEVCDAVGQVDESSAAFARVARAFSKRKEAWLLVAAWLEEEVGIHRSVITLLRRVAAGAWLGPPLIHEDRRLHAVMGDFEHVDAVALNRSPASVRVLEALFNRVLDDRRRTNSAPLPTAGKLVLLTGSLGTGGAERQLVTTAIGLNAMSLQQRTLPDGLALNAVHVVARSLTDREDGSFYAADLQRAGICVESYRDWPDFGGDLTTSVARPALRALAFLPWSTAEAVIKLSDRLKEMKPAVVHIWQDGLVYAAGLAALLAGIPRIVLSGRSAPPPDRRERYLVEYDVIYRSLLQAPGVVLSVNSQYAAQRYAKWLGIDRRLVVVSPNGVAPPSVEGSIASQAQFLSFEARVANATVTIGAVMRLDEVKRPVLWIDTAAAILARVPNARFIVVGDGPFRRRVLKRAAKLHIADRCQFVGRTADVGYWLEKMDLMMLLSEHEGLPNALIEAQLAGVPVVASAAGGASETFIPGRTGVLTSVAATPDEIAAEVAKLVGQPARLRSMAVEAKAWARQAFPVPRMLANTLDLYTAAGLADVAADFGDVRAVAT